MQKRTNNKLFDASKKRNTTTNYFRYEIMIFKNQNSYPAKTKNAKEVGKATSKAALEANIKKNREMV